MATRRVRNIDRINVDIGQVSFVVPDVVREELLRMRRRDDAKGRDAARTLEFARGMAVLDVTGRPDVGGAAAGESDGAAFFSGGAVHADDAILEYAARHSGIVATMDRNLKRRLKEAGCSVMSFSRDSVVLEP